MPSESLIQFRQLVEKVFSDKEAIRRSTDSKTYQHLFSKQYEAIIKIILAVKNIDGLSQLMKAYLALYEQYRQNKENIHFYRSDQVFLILVEQSGKVPVEKRDLLNEYASHIEGNDKTLVLKKRFLGLSDTVQSQVMSAINAAREKRRAEKSILETLKDEYAKQHHFPAKTNEDLYNFDPYHREAFKYGFERQLNALRLVWGTCLNDFKKENQEALSLALDEFHRYTVGVSKESSLKLFQVIKYLQDLIWDKREGGYENRGRPATKVTSGDKSPIIIEAYSIACLQLIVHAATDKVLLRNKNGFTPEEQAYFIAPIASYQYSSDIAIRFSVGLGNVAALFDQGKHFLNLFLLTKHQLKGMTLVELQKVLQIQNTWKQIHELGQQLNGQELANQVRILGNIENLSILVELAKITNIKLSMAQGPELGKGDLAIGDPLGEQSIHGKMKIIYINPANHDEIYIEIESLKPQLFLVNTNYIANKLYGTRIYNIYKSTVGITYINEFLFLAMGFLPVLIEAGFVGMLYEIGVYFASVKLEEIASEIDPRLGAAVGLLAQIAIPRPNFKPNIVNPVTHSSSSVIVLEAATQESVRSLAEIIQAQHAEGKLTSDFNKGTLAKLKDRMADKAVQLDTQVEKAAGWVQEKVPELLAVREPVPAGGAMFRVRDGTMTSGKSVGGGRGIAQPTRAELRLRKSDAHQQLETYYELLFKEERQIAEKEIQAVIDDLNMGKLTHSQASQKVTNVLNGAKEITGEYIADGAIHGNFDVISEVRIPRRGEKGAPMLDKVYKVRNPASKEAEYLLVEVKGGERTRLGKITAKKFQPQGGTIEITLDPSRMVKQGTGEWYYQKIVEIYGAKGAGNQALAKELFAYAKSGKIRAAIIKSGRKLDPYVTENTGEVVTFFKDLESPFPK